MGVCLVLVVAGCIGASGMVLSSVLRRSEADGAALRELVLRLSIPPDDPEGVPAVPDDPEPPTDLYGWPALGSDPTDGFVPEPWPLDNANRAVVLEPGEEPWPHLVGGKDAEWP